MVEQVDRALELCPFCGGDAQLMGNVGQPVERWYVTCSPCGIELDANVVEPGAAITAWNTRHRTEATAALEERVKLLEAENARVWRERNIAYAKVKAWEAVVYVEGLPLRAARVDEWGPGEGEQTTVPELTPKRLVDLLDRLATLEREALNDPR